jgi:PDDEXK-like domain of unknown function (DUF3799)
MSIDTAGIVDIPEADYHADPIDGGSLSATGAKRILECPAKYNYDRHTPQQHKAVFDFGTAAHRQVLGVGADITVIDADDWRTKDAKTAATEARNNGATPILAKDWATIQAMATALRLHPIASALLDPTNGKPEQSLFWHADIWRRARVDWLPDTPQSGGRLVVTDYKTTTDASPRGFSRSVANYGYHQQADWYTDGIRTLTGHDVAFVFIAQEKEPPYVVSVFELTDSALRIGAHRNDVAVARWIECTRTGIWPGYVTDITALALPRWAELEHEDQVAQQQEGMVVSW